MLHDDCLGEIGVNCARRSKKRIFMENMARNGRTEAGWGGYSSFLRSPRPRVRLTEVADQTTYVSVYDHWGGLDGH